MRISVHQWFLFLLSIASIVNATALNPLSVYSTSVASIFDSGISYNVFSLKFEFWEEVKNLGDKAGRYVNDQLELFSSNDTSIAEGLHDFKATWQHVVTAVGDMQPVDSGSLLEQHGLDSSDFATFFSTHMEKVAEQLMAELKEPLPEDQSERYKQRESVINTALNMTEDVLVQAYNQFSDMPEEEVREKFGLVKPPICHSILVMGNLADNHPYIMEFIVFSAAIMLLPELSILRPIARIFGIGPIGVGKGTPAAWAQRFFFGGTIPENSWFSWLQRAGMTRPGGILAGLKRLFCGWFKFC